MTNLEKLKNDYNFLNEKLKSSEKAAKHHAKIMKLLKKAGFIPNPVQQVVVRQYFYDNTYNPPQEINYKRPQ